ncbi:MAG: hypothetical protein EBU90_01725 [Proteobacteria bacterium]|nr:hypothetical protein [Pseudomonadota bacterium]
MSQLTKKLILSKIRQEDVFETYGIPVTKKSILNPFRKDTKPSCSFYNNKGKLSLYDHGTKQFYDCFDVVQNIHCCNFDMALRIIARDFNIDYEGKKPIGEPIKVKSAPINNLFSSSGKEKEIIVKERHFEKVDKMFWYDKYQITSKTLTKFKVFAIDRLWIEKVLVYTYNEENPGYAYYLGETHYKLYFPYAKIKSGEPKFIQNTNSKIMGYRQLPEKGKLIFITKSLKDVMCLYELGYNAVAPLSENASYNPKFIELLKNRFEESIIFYDNDETGIQYAKDRSAETGWPYITLPGEEKDISDFIEAYDMFSAKYLIETLINPKHENGFTNLPF